MPDLFVPRRRKGTDPLTFALGTRLLAGVAFAACLLPALRARRFDPARLLRYESRYGDTQS